MGPELGAHHGHRRLGGGALGVDDRARGARQQLQPVLRFDEFLDAVHLAARVDLPDAFGHRLHLRLPERACKRMDLPVDVRFGDVVEIDEGQLAHTADGTLVDVLEVNGDWATVKSFGNPVRYDRLVSTLKAVR